MPMNIKTIKVSDDDHKTFKTIAAKLGKSMQDLFHEWVKAYKGKK